MCKKPRKNQKTLKPQTYAQTRQYKRQNEYYKNTKKKKKRKKGNLPSSIAPKSSQKKTRKNTKNANTLRKLSHIYPKRTRKNNRNSKKFKPSLPNNKNLASKRMRHHTPALRPLTNSRITINRRNLLNQPAVLEAVSANMKNKHSRIPQKLPAATRNTPRITYLLFKSKKKSSTSKKPGQS